MSDPALDAALASIVRKLVHQAHHAEDGRPFVLFTDADRWVVIDGCVEDLTDEEMAALRALDDAESATAESLNVD